MSGRLRTEAPIQALSWVESWLYGQVMGSLNKEPIRTWPSRMRGTSDMRCTLQLQVGCGMLMHLIENVQQEELKGCGV